MIVLVIVYKRMGNMMDRLILKLVLLLLNFKLLNLVLKEKCMKLRLKFCLEVKY